MFTKLNKLYDRLEEPKRFLIFLFGVLLPFIVLTNIVRSVGLIYLLIIVSIRVPYIIRNK